jgi:predicted transcriptional regulator
MRDAGFVELKGMGRRKVYLLTERGKHLLKALG